MSNIVPVKQAPLAGLAGYGGGVPGLFYVGAAGTSDADITKSLRFNGADSAYLHRTPSSAGNRKTWTFSTWCKISAPGQAEIIFNAQNGTTQNFANNFWILFDAGVLSVGDGSTDFLYSQTLRDPSAWYHIVVACDTTQSSASDRLKIYINGVEANYTGDSRSSISQNSDTAINSTYMHRIGDSGSYHAYLDAYLTDVYFIDGSALNATSFGAFDDNGVWQASGFTGGYGSNGFHLLDFANESTVGHDSSVNNNDFTAVNISTTAGAGNDVLFDVPMNGDTSSESGAGGEVSGCYATLNPLQAITNSPTNGNLEIGGTSTGTYSKSVSTIHIDPEDTTGYYCEFTVVATGTNAAGHIQLIPQLNVTNNGKGETGGVGLGMRGSSAGNRWYKLTDQSSGTDTGVSHAADQVIGVAVKNGKLYMAINNTWVLSGNPATESNPLYSSLSGLKGFLVGTLDGSWQCNWGQRPFTYSAPTGYRPVSSASLPTATVLNGRKYFDILTYTGITQSPRTLTGLGIAEPDWVWVKNRDDTSPHLIWDAVRGTDKNMRTDTTNDESSVSGSANGIISTSAANGFVVKNGSGSGTNAGSSGSDDIVAWCWEAGSSTVTNNVGDITTTLRANPTAGFSIATYSGSGTSGDTLGHGLNADPEFVIIKARDKTDDWRIYHKGVGTGHYLRLNGDHAKTTTNNWQSISTTTFGIDNDSAVNSSSYTYVAYFFAPVAGYSAMGLYESNNSTDGPFIFTGFRPAFILFKADAANQPWIIHDSARNGFNKTDPYLMPSNDSAELSDNGIDILSNGWKIRNNNAAWNGTAGQDYVWVAFAENPFQANGGLAR